MIAAVPAGVICYHIVIALLEQGAYTPRIFTKKGDDLHEKALSLLAALVMLFFVIYLIGYSTFLFSSVVVGGNQLFEDMKKKQLQNEIHHDFYVPISIIIPAHNEEVTIAETIKSLMYLDYRLYEVIVVNDRSTDSTGELVAETFHLHKVMRPIRRQLPCQDPISVFEGTLKKGISITLINKTNGGKASAQKADSCPANSGI